MNQIQEFTYLYQRYKDETCTPAERQAFMELVRKPEMAAALKELIGKDATGFDKGLIPITKELSRERAEELFQLILAAPSAASTEFTPQAVSLTTKRRWWPAAAAAVLLLLAGAGYVFFNGHAPMPVASLPLVKAPQHDALPGGNKAMLTLSNGSVIVLDSAANGLLAEQGNAKISKLKNGQLAYEERGAGDAGKSGADGKAGAAGRTGGTAGAGGMGEEKMGAVEKPGETVYNTLTTPRGGQYQLVLPDGTKVWLNAASSITYPTSFAGAERRITMTGEAYFEVTKMPAARSAGQRGEGEAGGSRDAKDDGDRVGAGHIPFIVVANGTEVEVLGTHFNINAYKEDPAVLTTLLEGSVKVSAHGKQQLIRPGEQTAVTPSGTGIGLNKDVDLDEVIAWKNGYFQFDHADIQTIMRQVARWYDVEISYEGKVPERKFGGDISRDLKLSEVLYGLNLSKIHFRIEGKKLVILP